MKYKKRTKTKNDNTQPIKELPKTENSDFFGKYIAPYAVWIVSGLIILIGIIAFRKFLFGEYLFFFKDIGSDSINQNYPAIVHRVRLMQEGFISKWSFYTGMGQNYYTGFPVEPWSWLNTLINNIGVAIWGDAYYVNGRFLHIFLTQFLPTGVLFYFYLRTLNVKKFASVIGSLSIAFSGYIVVGSAWGFSSHVLKAVFLLFAFEQLFVKKRWYFFPFSVILFSENFFTLYIYAFFLFVYSIFRFIQFDKEQAKILNYLKLAGQMILLGGIGLLMNSVNTIRGLLTLINSPRVSGNASYSQALQAGEALIDNSSFAATTLLRFFSNDLIGNGSKFAGWNNYLEAPIFYIGLLALLLAPQVFIYIDNKKRIIFGTFLAFWLSTLFFPMLRHAILGFTGDYFRYGFDFFIPFTILFYSIYALNQLDKKFKLNYYLLGGTALVLLALVYIPYNSLPTNSVDNQLQMIVAFLLLAYTFLLVLMSLPNFKHIGQIGILLLLVFELSFSAHKSYSERDALAKSEFETNKAGYSDGSSKAVEFIYNQDDTKFFRIEKDYQSGSSIHGSLNDAMAQLYYGTTSYSSFNQLNYIRFQEEIGLIQKGDETATRWSRGLRGNPLLETFGNVKYYLSKEKNPPYKNFGYDSLTTIGDVQVLKNKFYLPFGYTYDKYITLSDLQSLIKYRYTAQTSEMLNLELSGKGFSPQQILPILQKLNTLENKEFTDKNLFDEQIKIALGNDYSEQIAMLTAKHSSINFKVQLALLNAFVLEHDQKINTKSFEQILPSDTTIFVDAKDFNLEVYGGFIKELKQDTLQITEFLQHKISGEISLSKEKMLFLSIPYDEGWQLTVNDKKTELLRTNIGFCGVILPAGNHKIELKYVPAYSQISSLISIITIIGFWAFLIFWIIKKRRNNKTKNENKTIKS